MKALVQVAGQPRRGGLGFIDAQHLGALQRQPPCHDETDIPAAENDAFFGGEQPQQVGEMLRRPGGKDPGGAGAVDGHLLCCPFPAAGGQNKRLGMDLFQSLAVHRRDEKALLLFFDAGDKGEGQRLDLQGTELIDEAAGIFGAGELFAVAHQTEAVMDALLEDAAETGLPFQQQHLGAVFAGSYGSGQPRRASADNENINRTHRLPSLTWFCRR